MLMRNRTFRLIFVSDLLQQIAIWIRNMALLYYVMEKTNGDKFAVSLLSIVEYAPIFVFSIVGGLFADRWNPKRTMIAGDLLSAASIVVILALIAGDAWQSLYGAAFLSAILSQFSQPSSAKIFKKNIPEDQVPAAIGLTQSMSSLFLILGPVAGTAIYQWAGLNASLIALTLLFLLSAAVLSFLPKGKTGDANVSSTLREDLREGVRFMRGESQLKRLFLAFSLIGLGAGLVQPLEIFIVTERLGLSPDKVQWFAAADGFGLLLGALLAVAFTGLLKLRYLLPAAVAFMGVTYVVEALSVWPVATGAFRFANGVMMAIVNTAVGSYVIARIPAEMIGRVNGLMMPLFMGALLLGTSASGILSNTAGIVPAYMAAAVLCVLSAIPALSLRLSQDGQSEQAEGGVVRNG
ncbi:MFS transporter [Cohnella herbarum]|uniref:MFS transporter n=1 Tax=Cohnella herbarum TaxID=2728023 RepID=A0A7Z2ZNJ1_9BACL|nr:MFS transporter [Cohnella herbarum]QJD86496.1 MFS transporter [Cohnella herbarum]